MSEITLEDKSKHGQVGEYHMFIGSWNGTDYSGDRGGNDIYCGYCQTWNTVEGTNILFSVVGKCKNCGEPIGSAVVREVTEATTSKQE